jgi:RNA polymerase sigma factor (sigma-70 family)
MPNDSLNELAAEATAGNSAALRAMCQRVQGPVYRLALRMLGHPADAEDAAQEILIQVITHLSTFEGRSDLMTWVYTVAARHLMRARTRARESAMSPDELGAKLDQGLALAAHCEPLAPAEAPLLEKELQLHCTHAMFMLLSRPERLAYILADVLGATDTIGAEICETTPAAFRQRLARARAEMRPLLADRCGLADPKNPCQCAKQAPVARAMNLVDPKRLRFAKLAAEQDVDLTRADEQLSALRKMGGVFDREAPVAAPRSVWESLVAACPELLR